MTRIAEKDLNPIAVSKANEKLWAAHPELGGRELTMSSSDAAYRKEWMSHYRAAEASVARSKSRPLPPIPPSRVPKPLPPIPTSRVPKPLPPIPPSRASSPTGAVGTQDVGSGTATCPYQAAKDRATPTALCEIVLATATCQHNADGPRMAEGGQILDVVPDEKVGADTVTLAAVGAKCGEHPEWEIRGKDVQKLKGAAQKYRVSGWRGGLAWMPRIRPHEYAVSVKGCQGKTHRLWIHAYPNDKLSFEFNAKEVWGYLDALEKGMEVLSSCVPTPTFKWLEGTIKAEGEWAEAAGREAFWKYEIAVGFNPLLGVEWKLPLFTPLPVPKWILTCGIYLTLFGEINVNVKLVRTTPRFKTGEGQSAAEGKLGGRLSAEISAGNGELFKASASGETSISLTSKGFTDEKGYGLDGCEFSWDGVTGAFEATALHGIFKFKRGVQLIKPRLIGSKSKKYYLPFGKKDARPAANPAAPVGTPKPVGTHLPPPSSGGRKPLPPLPPKKKTGPAPKAPPRPARPLPPIPKPRTSGGSRSGGESGSSSSSTGSRDGS